MSEEQESATPESTTAEAATAAAGATGEGNATETSKGSSGNGDLEERMRRDPEFAIEQYKQIQRGMTQASQKAKAAERALQLAEAVGQGDRQQGMQIIEKSLNDYGMVRTNPQLRKFVDRYLQTGKIGELDDLEQDDTEEEDPHQAEIRALRQELDGLKRGQAKSQIRTDMEKLLEQIPDEHRGEVANGLEQQIQQLESQARNGSQQAHQALQNLNFRALRTMALASLWGDDQDLAESKLSSIVESLRAAKQDRKARASTGEPGVRSTGREDDSPGRDRSGRPSSVIAREAMREARQKFRIPE